MATFLWPGDAGWPKAEAEPSDELDLTDPAGEIDLDAVCLHAAPPGTFDTLTPLERTVLSARFGLDGSEVRSMKELHNELGMTRHEVRDALESALAKLRDRLAC